MRSHWIAAVSALTTMSAAIPAHACLGDAELDLEDVRHADAVLVGRIANYAIVVDREGRRELGRDPGPGMFLPDYARFDVVVDEVLLGNVEGTVSVTWDNSTFPEPESMPSGPFLIALRYPGSSRPPLRGPSATILPNREPASLTVLQAPCAVPFIFERASENAGAIRRILERRSWRPGSG